MINKRGTSIAAFVFVVIVVVVSLFALTAFIKNSSKILTSLSDVSSVTYFMFEKENAENYLKVISDQAVVQSYQETVDKLSKSSTLSGKDYVILNSDSFSSEDYRSVFVTNFKNNLVGGFNKYSNVEEIKALSSLANDANVSFDGNKLIILLKGYKINYLDNSKPNYADYIVDVGYNISLNRFELLDLTKFSSLAVNCPYSVISVDPKCVEDNFPGFVLDKEKSEIISSEIIKYYHAALVSKRDYFVDGKLVKLYVNALVANSS